jgi:7SK snRNA methylphosphate capping enzyme
MSSTSADGHGLHRALLAHVYSKREAAWKRNKPINTWADRSSAEPPLTAAQSKAWDLFDDREAEKLEQLSNANDSGGRAALGDDASLSSQRKRKRKDKEFWIEPAALNAAGFPVGKRCIANANGELVRSHHGERRDRKRKAAHEARSGGCSSTSPAVAAPDVAAPAAVVDETTKAAPLVVDPFHGRLVPALPPPRPAGVRRPHSGSKRRQRRRKLREATAASGAADSERSGGAGAAALDAVQGEDPTVSGPQQQSGGAVTDDAKASSTSQDLNVKRGNKSIFPYGNYDAYYGYRYAGGPVPASGGGTEDPRLSALDASWFAGKDCLDIGCNTGQLTIAVARQFGVKSMLGVDIDASLVERAQANWRSVRSSSVEPLRQLAPPPKALAPRTSSGGLTNEDFRKMLLGRSSPVAQAPAAAGSCAAPSTTTTMPAALPAVAVRFAQCNFVQEPPGNVQPPAGDFDVVSCFSTAKWVHLNFGDEGLRTLFRRAYACLRPGGLFLLEPQPWSSYRKRMHLTPAISRNFREIQLRPPVFSELLTSHEVGFASAQQVEVPYGTGTGIGANFRRRPLIIAWKAA